MKERNFAEKILMIFSKGSNCIYYPINAINVDSHFKLKQRLGLGWRVCHFIYSWMLLYIDRLPSHCYMIELRKGWWIYWYFFVACV